MKKNIGIIGKGKLIQKWVDSLDKETLPQVQEVIFYNHRSPILSLTKDEKYQQIKSRLEQANILVTETPKFDDFYSKANVVIFAASQPYPDNLRERLTEELRVIVTDGPQPLKDALDAPKLNLERFLYVAEKLYQLEEFKMTQRDIFSRIKTDFLREEPTLQAKVMTAVIEAKRDGFFPLGSRTLGTFPACVPLVLDYANKFSEQINTFGRKAKPLIVATNEPTLCCDLFSMGCPEMTSKIYGLSSFDGRRLNELLEEKFGTDLEKHGLERDLLTKRNIFTVIGDHDSYQIPIIFPIGSEDFSVTEKLHSAADYRTLYYYLRHTLPYLYFILEEKSKDPNEGVNGALNKLLNSLLESENSLFYTKNDSSNSVFHQEQGLFLVNRHQLLNQRPILLNNPRKSLEETISLTELRECTIAHTALLKKIQALLEEIYQPKTFFLPKAKERPFSTLNWLPERGTENCCSYLENIGQNFVVAADNRLHFLTLEKHHLTPSRAPYKLGHQCNALGIDYTKNLPLLLIGYSQGLRILNLDQDQEKKIFFDLEKSLYHGWPDYGFNNIFVLDNKVVASHFRWGVFGFGLDLIHEPTVITIGGNSKPLFLLGNLVPEEYCSAKVYRGEQLFVSKDNKMIIYEPHSLEKIQQVYAFGSLVSDFCFGQDQGFFVGTKSGEIYRLSLGQEPSVLFQSKEQHPIRNLQANQEKIYFNRYSGAYGPVFGLNLSDGRLVTFDFNAKWLGVSRDVLFANDYGTGVFKIYDLKNDKTVAAHKLSGIGLKGLDYLHKIKRRE